MCRPIVYICCFFVFSFYKLLINHTESNSKAHQFLLRLYYLTKWISKYRVNTGNRTFLMISRYSVIFLLKIKINTLKRLSLFAICNDMCNLWKITPNLWCPSSFNAVFQLFLEIRSSHGSSSHHRLYPLLISDYLLTVMCEARESIHVI